MSRPIWIIASFLLLVALLAFGLTQDPSRVPSPLIDKPFPDFSASLLSQPAKQLNKAALRGPAIVNVWASWCVGCREEHPLLIAEKEKGTRIYGINYKDTAQDAKRWLKEHGDPYALSLVDPQGAMGIDLGVYAIPETFVVDRDLVIRYKHIGPLDSAMMEREIRPLLQALAQGSDALQQGATP